MINIVMLTFNQEKYIAKAIESVLMQIDAPNYNIIIGDDFSSDETSNICLNYKNKYPEKITYLRSPKNVGLIDNYIKCFSYCQNEYVAILEGDDYWTDPYKLSKQYSILKSNENIALVHTNYLLFNQTRNKLTPLPNKVIENTKALHGHVLNKLLERNFVCAPTVMFKKSVIENINFDEVKSLNFRTIDLLLWLECARIHDIYFQNEVTTVYRVIDHSISHNRDLSNRESWIISQLAIKKYFIEKYNILSIDFDKTQSKLYFKLAMISIINLNFKKFFYYISNSSFDSFFLLVKDWKTYHWK